MERHRCKLCFRNFANGRALGGHMRSHMMKLYAGRKEAAAAAADHDDQSNNIQESDEFDQYSSSTSDDDDDELEVMVQDRESETEHIPGRRRSKRVRRLGQLAVEHEPLSSISDTTPEEHVAHCLMMLSRDKWSRDDGDHDDLDNGGEKVVDFVEDDYSEDSKVVIKSSSTSGGGGTSSKVRGKYRCETCNKSFRSYQALGGHRASHKKIRVNEPGPGGPVAEAGAVEERVHECPFCHRVFASGQALGGHKRSHFVNGITVNVVKQSSRVNGEGLNIDLNLPAPVDTDGDYCDDEISQVAVSAVSDEEFVQPR